MGVGLERAGQGLSPRAPGEPGEGSPQMQTRRGLSPRARGNLTEVIAEKLKERSIPAGAGEPRIGIRKMPIISVYPRGRGGTQHLSHPLIETLRSIPAGAGEPSCTRWHGTIERVYPRGRGGTPLFGAVQVTEMGLSPRARGNRQQSCARIGVFRSIPAGAGEPAFSVG